MFKIPLETEILTYVKEVNEKKGYNWPIEFCKYYTERFYNFYQSNGWKVSGRAAMKDWKAAFNSQWQTIKFKEDIEELNKWKGAQKNTPLKSKDVVDPMARLDLRMQQYLKDDSSIPDGVYLNIYDYIQPKGMIVVDSEQEEIIEKMTSFCEDENEGAQRRKMLEVKFTFINMNAKGKTFYGSGKSVQKRS